MGKAALKNYFGSEKQGPNKTQQGKPTLTGRNGTSHGRICFFLNGIEEVKIKSTTPRLKSGACDGGCNAKVD